MIENQFHRGFSDERLTARPEPKVRKDDSGYYIMSLSENTKVYFEDFYQFLETTNLRAKSEKALLENKLAETPADRVETLSFYRAKAIVVDLLVRTVRRFYTDGSNLGVVMTPWCFGTVVLEKLEVYKERLSKGEVRDPNVGEYPYYVCRYIEEIHRQVLLDLFDFPEQAFNMRWQYSELLKRYSGILSDINSSLNSVLMKIRKYGS
ncbi:MAG: hypothetical protein ACE5FH_09075 [Candidatus Zixiibacteriota bacterium]